jgi:flagellar basal-body rod modification protein FlgD
MSTALIGALGQQGQQVPTGHDAWGKVDLKEFINLLVAELQNQDPLNPMDNSEILQQVSQIQEIESNQRLTQTLESVLLGQNVATASNLLGRTIVALTEGNERITGQVDRVSIQDGIARIHIGEHTIGLKNLAEILPEGGDNAQDDGA